MQMVPFSLWRRNLRAVMGKKSHWRRLRETFLKEHGLSCAGCGKAVSESRALKAHEEWIYLERTEPAVAWLWRVSLLCFHCHAVEHPGALNAMIAEGSVTERARTDTIAHFCAVNGVAKRQWNAQLRAATKDFERRSCRTWYVDYGPFTEWMVTSFLADPLNGEPWPDDLIKKYGNNHLPPTIESIVSALPVSSQEVLPESQRGVIAHLFEAIAASKRAERQRKAQKRKRTQLKTKGRSLATASPARGSGS